MSRSRKDNAVPPGAIRQPKALAAGAWCALIFGALLALAGIGGFLPNQSATAAPTSVGQGIGFLTLGLALLILGIFAFRYYKNNYIVLLPTEIVQCTASKRIKRLQYKSVLHIEESSTLWGPVVWITGVDGTTIRIDITKIDVAGLKREVARHR